MRVCSLVAVVDVSVRLAISALIEKPMRFSVTSQRRSTWVGKSESVVTRLRTNLPSKRKKQIKNIPQTQEDVLVEDVQITGKQRERDPEKVHTLAASISMVGIRTRITVRRIEKERDGVSTTVLWLVAGGYRLQAFKSLGLSRIPAFVIEGDKSDARILTADREPVSGRAHCSPAR